MDLRPLMMPFPFRTPARAALLLLLLTLLCLIVSNAFSWPQSLAADLAAAGHGLHRFCQCGAALHHGRLHRLGRRSGPPHDDLGHLLGAGLVLRFGGHVAIDNLHRSVSPQGAPCAAWSCGPGGFFAVMTVTSSQYVYATRFQTTAATDIPISYIYGAMPVGFVLMLIHLLFMRAATSPQAASPSPMKWMRCRASI
jgi:TRAP-type C4-dicarboxylate transport system permease small subunit